MSEQPTQPDSVPSDLIEKIHLWAGELGFTGTGISDVDLEDHEAHLINWLKQGYHGSMDYMERHGTMRSRPQELVPGTLKVISVRLDYFPPESAEEWPLLETLDNGYISRYALGRDYHKLMRSKLQKLAKLIEDAVGPFGYRAFVDSAPVLEKALAEKSGLGWIGKHSNVVNRQQGSWFFLGELFTNLPLPTDQPAEDHCGNCSACMDICPTQAIIGERQVDARRCISYLTIEHHGSIDEALRPLMGNRIYGCDDCQLACPWNRFSQRSQLADFAVRNHLDNPALIDLFNWTEEEFMSRLEGSAIRRIGHASWLRNIAIALGNGNPEPEAIEALQAKQEHPSEIVREHVNWALDRLSTG